MFVIPNNERKYKEGNLELQIVRKQQIKWSLLIIILIFLLHH